MTEEEWLTGTDALRLVEHVHPRARTRSRKYLLLNCACCRHLTPRFADDRLAQAIDRAERGADGGLTEPTLKKWQGLVATAKCAARARSPAEVRAAHAVESLFSDRRTSYPPVMHGWRALCIDQAVFGREFASAAPGIGLGLIRDIFGNPFRPVAFDPSWRTSTAVVLARQMYESREFSAMPILADALQDAGCEDPDILGHCRGPGPHVRGCWVVDLVLGKA
jgi:hypothetical protein